MSDTINSFFAELVSGITEFFAIVFDVIFVNMYNSFVYHGKNLVGFIETVAGVSDLSSIFNGNFIYFVLGIPVVFFMLRLIVQVVRG